MLCVPPTSWRSVQHPQVPGPWLGGLNPGLRPRGWDYATVQTVGMTLATIMFVLGIIIILSKSVLRGLPAAPGWPLSPSLCPVSCVAPSPNRQEGEVQEGGLQVGEVWPPAGGRGVRAGGRGVRGRGRLVGGAGEGVAEAGGLPSLRPGCRSSSRSSLSFCLHSPTCKSCKSELPSSGEAAGGC
ncbi:Hypothetical predicted protein [Marmota monax]|uniref:FXYD domain-containing ion transport regulator n=1 Tax=Marmota monax TaxID=9995 RepID=A0A5E4AF19_MARMO|nr:hypothetical protein GHT09_018414 [Marmota monax]VTJ55858.1 Hypothetical predicted protein [Marmota monax]